MKRKLWILTGICAVALAVRLLSLHAVFGGTFVSFLETDAYSRMWYAKEIAAMPFWSGVTYMFSNNLLFSWLVATTSHVLPIEIAGACWPPVLGVGTVVLVYLFTTRLFSPVVGLLAAAFTAIIPSEFLHRTLLGFADHHALEVFLLVLALYLVVRAWQSSRRYWYWASGGGITLLAYVVNWKAGLIVLGMLGVTALVLYVLRHRRSAITMGAAITLALAVYLPLGGWQFFAGLLPGTPAGDLPVAAQTTQEIADTVTSEFGSRTISELRPLLSPEGSFSIHVLLSNLHLFTPAFLLGAVLLWRKSDIDRPTKVLILLWSACMLAATLLFRRNLYYFTVNVAILSAYGVWELAHYLKGKPVVQAVLLAGPLVLMSIPGASLMGQVPQFQMSEEWHTALVWLRNQPVSGHVTAWTDFGHWIKYETGYEPNALPGPGGSDVAQLLLSTDDTDAVRLMDALDTDYLIVDAFTMMAKGTAVAMVAGEKRPVLLDGTLMFRLWHYRDVPTVLEPVYQSESIRIYRYTGRSL